VNTGSDSVQYYDFITNEVKTVHLNNDRPTAATVYRGKLYYANQDDNAIHVANKTTGADNSILRNNTGEFILGFAGLALCYVCIDDSLFSGSSGHLL
jgi:hypothetical protein